MKTPITISMPDEIALRELNLFLDVPFVRTLGYSLIFHIFFNLEIKHDEIIRDFSGKMNFCQSVYKPDKEISLNE